MVQDTLVRYRVQIAKASSPLLLPDHFHCIALSDEITINDGGILSQCETRYLIIPVFQNLL